MWAGLLAGALNVMLQSLTGLDRQADTPGRMRIATLRQQLLAVPGRLISHARDLILRLPRPAEPAGRPGPAAGTPRTHLTAQPYPNEQGPLRHRPRRRVLMYAHTHPDDAATEVTPPGTRSQR